MQPDTEHVHAEPRETRDDIAENSHGHESLFSNHTTPARVQHGRIPQDNQQSSIFLRVPSPESPPGLVRPGSSQDGSDETEQRRKTNNAVNHARDVLPGFREQRSGKETSENI